MKGEEGVAHLAKMFGGHVHCIVRVKQETLNYI